jgi:hypothetical protein
MKISGFAGNAGVSPALPLDSMLLLLLIPAGETPSLPGLLFSKQLFSIRPTGNRKPETGNPFLPEYIFYFVEDIPFLNEFIVLADLG